MQKLENIMQLYNLFTFFFLFKFLLMNKRLFLNYKISYTNKRKKKLFFIITRNNNFLKFILIFNKKIFYFKNLKKRFFKKLKWKIKRKVLKRYLNKIVMFFIIKIKIFSLFKNVNVFYFSFRFKKKVAINKVVRRRKVFFNYIRWHYFLIFRKLLKKNLNFKFKSFFNKSHSKVNEKLKKLRRK